MKNTYESYAKSRAPASCAPKNLLAAFLCGGTACALAEGEERLLASWGMEEEAAGLAVTLTLILLTALLTGIGVWDKYARRAGAGALVPITGFANAVVSCALDARDEGPVLGIGPGIFRVAGPVLLWGTAAGTLEGIVLYIVSLFGGSV